MVEPSDNLQAVFEKALETAKKLHHEYLTIEHLLFAMLSMHQQQILFAAFHVLHKGIQIKIFLVCIVFIKPMVWSCITSVLRPN